MSFPTAVRQEALVRSHRRCCVCHEFAGRNVNVHHITQEAAGGANDISNAIVLCLRCHADAGHYNAAHPLGTKYSPDELRRHRDQWWAHCESAPEEPVGCGLDVAYVKDPSSNGEVHTYWLTVSFANTSPSKIAGYTLELLFPLEIPVQCKAADYQVDEKPVAIDQARFRKLTLTSGETIYRGQTIQIVDHIRRPISYRMDHRLYAAAHGGKWQLRSNLYAGDLPPVRDTVAWEEMHRF
ncbi:MAG: HNH endonuclease [Sedimentisphaerales bacterium]|nr:HNH endonuclease [Sedimentisphaerales bacterium]